ncbi:hypothetical protein ACH347_18510 [Saccharopolyspora sp. 5N102]|uniref:hypothetical protein n=1 Tax=Saccharopolyspora sp. 5N102 TaxID=3375155 RepID=UPI0037AAA4B2
MDRIAAEGWKGLREGERDDLDSRVLSPWECAARDNVGQPYSIRASISYETHNFDATGKTRSFDLHVITTAVARKGQRVTHQNTTDALIKAFEITGKHI